jgi:hypothetical protein
MNALDILYTPLDTPLAPDIDTDKLLAWVKEHSPSQNIINRLDASKVSTVTDTYPWNIVYPMDKKSWCFDFDREFPELADFFSSAYKVNPSDLRKIVLLPVKPEFSGLGFWHSDPDSTGLRMYLKNQDTEDFLLINPTVEPYDVRPDFSLTNFDNVPLQNKIHSAKLLNPRQTFYINNVRAVHAAKVTSNTARIAVIVFPEPENIKDHLNRLVVESAKKYSDYALHWQLPT